jgi:peptidoglycan/xylan/chitin deacetylase (PgdA/CDA1 family)
MFKRKKLAFVLGLVAVLSLCGAGFMRGQYVLPIAMYHSVAPVVPEGNRLIVSVKTFERQMAFLKKNGYNAVTLDEAARMINEKNRIPARTIVLTFDDGNRDNYTYAFPILKKYRIPATIFIIVSKVGEPDKLNWEQIKEMRDSGLVVFGSHSLNHPFLENIEDGEILKKEIKDSKNILEENLKKEVSTFSYPCGRLNSRVRQEVVSAGYKAAVVTNPGKNCPDDDIFALKRLRISENASNMFVFWIETSGYYNFIRENRHK